MTIRFKSRRRIIAASVAFILCVGVLLSMLAMLTMLVGCQSGGASTEPIMTVNGSPISEGEFIFYLNQIKLQVTQGQEIDEATFWETPLTGNKKASEYAIEAAKEQIIASNVMTNMAKEQNITLTSEDITQIDGYIQSWKDQLGSETAYAEWLKSNGLSKELHKQLYENSSYAQKLAAKMATDLTDDQVKAYYNDQMVRVKHVLLNTSNSETGEPLSQSDQAAVKEKADMVREFALLGEDFDKLIEEYSQDPGSFTTPDGYLVGRNGGWVKEFEDASLLLKMDEISPVTKSTFGYHIIKRIANPESDLENKRDAVVNVIVLNDIQAAIEKADVVSKDEKMTELFNK